MKMRLRNETILTIGTFSMTAAILIGRFFEFSYTGFSVTDFLEGLFTGLSIVFNLTYLVRLRRLRGRKDDNALPREGTGSMLN